MSNTISCIIVDDENVAREIIASHLSRIENIEVIAQCKNAIEAFNFINNNAVDLIFLDINMPEISGIAFAKSINKNIKIIFTTAYRDYAVEGFNLQAVDYLLKPISFERMLQAINRYFEVSTQQIETQSQPSETNDFIFVRSDRRMLKIIFKDIIFIESLSDYLKIHLKDQSIITRETISAIETKLPQKDFLRIHRSYIVNLASIESFTNEEMIVNGKCLTISRSYKKDVITKLERF